jgi:serine/threonine protein kinase
MGIVYRAREVALDRPVAIKVLRPELATAVARERFLREARLLARLQHPNIVPVHRADERDGLPFYVMDFVEGRTLAERIAAGPLAGLELLRLANDLCRALVASHEAGITHRDVKPANIFLVGGRGLLGDFGIAREADADSADFTADGFAIGTRQYMAPEQLKGRPATDRSDQYAAAAVLYEAATGRPWETLADPAKANWRGVPGSMARALRRALAPEPEARWSSVREMRRAIARAWRRPVRQALLIAAALIGAVVIGSRIPRLGPRPRNHRALAVLPFTVVGAPHDSVGWRVAEFTDINLYYFPALSRVPFKKNADWRRDHPDEDAATALDSLAADHVITGLLERRGDSLSLQLFITTAGASTPVPPIRLTAAYGDSQDLGRQAAIAIGTRLGATAGTDVVNLASSVPEAVGQFMAGEELFDGDAWHLAARSYAAAVAYDSSFALARWRLIVARIWAREISWDSVRALARCCAERLPPLDSGLVQAMGDTNLPRRFQQFDALIARFGPEGSLPFLFASDLFHRGPLVGRGLANSLAMFQQSIDARQGATPAPAYDHMVWGKTRLGEREEAERWLRARKRLGGTAPEEPPIVEFLALGTDLRWAPWTARAKLWMLDHFGAEQDIRSLAKFFRFSAAWDLPEGQQAVGKVIASRLLSTDRASGLEAQGLAQLTWGRVAQGLALIDSAARYFDTDEAELQRHQWRLLLPVLGAGRASAADEAAARRWLETRPAADRLAARAQWTLALDALRRHDSVQATTYLTRLKELGAADGATERLTRLATGIQIGDRDPRAALVETEPLRSFDSPEPGNDVFSRSILHLARARWFEEAGDAQGAAREILWYENSDTYSLPVREAQKMEVDAVASVAARVTRARLLGQAGEPADACRMLARVRELWHDADASVAPGAAEADSLFRADCR